MTKVYKVNNKYIQLSDEGYKTLISKLARAIQDELIRLQDMIDNKEDRPIWNPLL